MDQTSSANVKSPQSGGMSSQLFGSNFKKDNLEKRVQELLRQSTEYHELRKYVIQRGIDKIKGEGIFGKYGAAIPSIIALIASFFIDIKAFEGLIRNLNLIPGFEAINKGIPTPVWLEYFFVLMPVIV